MKLWNIPYHSERIQWGRHSWLSAFWGGASHRSDRTFSLGVKGCMLPVGGCLSILWVHTLTRTFMHTHTHCAPVTLGRFQPAASERSALEFLRPKEISNWVMDMVTWTMRRQRRRSREKEGEREREGEQNEGMKHNMSSLSISPPHDWPWLQCPKTNLSGN